MAPREQAPAAEQTVRGTGATDAASGVCERCIRLARTCPACAQRRRRAWMLVVQGGETVEAAAKRMNLAPRAVRRLVAEELDRLELDRLRCNAIPVSRTRAVITEALARNPHLSVADMADWLDMQVADFERAFLGKARDGRPKLRVNVANASRLMIALGRAPHELDGC